MPTSTRPVTIRNPVLAELLESGLSTLEYSYPRVYGSNKSQSANSSRVGLGGGDNVSVRTGYSRMTSSTTVTTTTTGSTVTGISRAGFRVRSGSTDGSDGRGGLSTFSLSELECQCLRCKTQRSGRYHLGPIPREEHEAQGTHVYTRKRRVETTESSDASDLPRYSAIMDENNPSPISPSSPDSTLSTNYTTAPTSPSTSNAHFQNDNDNQLASSSSIPGAIAVPLVDPPSFSQAMDAGAKPDPRPVQIPKPKPKTPKTKQPPKERDPPPPMSNRLRAAGFSIPVAPPQVSQPSRSDRIPTTIGLGSNTTARSVRTARTTRTNATNVTGRTSRTEVSTKSGKSVRSLWEKGTSKIKEWAKLRDSSEHSQRMGSTYKHGRTSMDVPPPVPILRSGVGR